MTFKGGFFQTELEGDKLCSMLCVYVFLNDTRSIALGCIYAESKEYPREQAAHVALRELTFTFVAVIMLTFSHGVADKIKLTYTQRLG